MRSRSGLLLLLACAVLTACTPRPTGPTPTGTLEPSITESSAEPTSRPTNAACKLLTAKERSDLVGMSMDAEVPVPRVSGTHECIWAHSLTEPARAAIRVSAVKGSEWVPTAADQLRRGIAHPATTKSLAAKLTDALRDIVSNPRDLSDERVCEIYLLFAETRGMTRAEDMLFAGAIGSLPTFYAASCENGYIVMAGFGEYGLTGSFAVNHAVFRLVTAAIGRVEDVFGTSSGADDEDADSDDDTTESPAPEPSDTADEADDASTESDES